MRKKSSLNLTQQYDGCWQALPDYTLAWPASYERYRNVPLLYLGHRWVPVGPQVSVIKLAVSAGELLVVEYRGSECQGT
jgi:hypothetical protein